MGKVVAGSMMSLDGFINDENGSVGRLYPDFEAIMNSAVMQESIRTTGAVVMGRRTFEMGDPDIYADMYEYQVPIFVVTHHPPANMPKQNEKLTFTFVTAGVERAIEQATIAAGERDVTIVGGAQTIRQGLRAGLIDELHIDIRQILLGSGLRLFENLEDDRVELEQISVVEGQGVTHLRYRVIYNH